MNKLFLAIASLAIVSAAQATTVTLSSAATGPSVFLSNGSSLLANGSLIRVGTLTTANDFTSFVEFGTSTIKNAGVGASAKPSKVTGSVTNNSGEADDTGFNNLPVYVWIYNATSLPVESGAQQLLEQGLFKSDTFVFPANDTAGVGDAVTATATSFLALTPVALPFQTTQASVSATGDNGTGNATGGRFVLGATVPEPSTGMLAGLVGLALAARRRR